MLNPPSILFLLSALNKDCFKGNAAVVFITTNLLTPFLVFFSLSTLGERQGRRAGGLRHGGARQEQDPSYG